MKKTCDACGGTGQLGSFRGVSRFVISWDECDECAGTGMIDQNGTPVQKEKRQDDDASSPAPIKQNHSRKK